MHFAKTVLSATLLALASGAVSANPDAPAPTDPPIRKLNGHLVDTKGRGLYMWDGDVKGDSSQCNAQCRLLWPPLFADDAAVPKGPFTIVKRDDGRYQWALNGRPLYRWTLVRDDVFVDYLGLPDAGGPAFLVLVQEPDRNTTGTTDASPADEVHHRLADGTLLHVSIWFRDGAPAVPADEPVTQPAAAGWTQVVVGEHGP